jgi:hypothetical protein
MRSGARQLPHGNDVEVSVVAQFGVAPFPVARCQIALQAFKLQTDALQATEGALTLRGGFWGAT